MNKNKKLRNISFIILIAFIFFFTGVVVGIYHMGRLYEKLNSVMTATLTVDVLGQLRENKEDKAIKLLEDQLDTAILRYGLVIKKPDFYLDSILSFIVTDDVPDEIYKRSFMQVGKYREKYPTKEEDEENKKIILETIKIN